VVIVGMLLAKSKPVQGLSRVLGMGHAVMHHHINVNARWAGNLGTVPCESALSGKHGLTSQSRKTELTNM